MSAKIFELPRTFGEPTGGASGYDLVAVQELPRAVPASSLQHAIQQFSSSISMDILAQALLNAIEGSLLPQDPRRLELYRAMSLYLDRRIAKFQQSAMNLGTAIYIPNIREDEIQREDEQEASYASYYERHESPEIVRAFLSLWKALPIEHEEPTQTYDSEDLEAFR